MSITSITAYFDNNKVWVNQNSIGYIHFYIQSKENDEKKVWDVIWISASIMYAYMLKEIKD